MKKLFVHIIFLSFAASAMGQSVQFFGTLDTNRILIGEQTRFNLTAKNLSNTADLLWPVWPDTLTSLEVLSTTTDTVVKDGFYTIHQKLLITSFDSGFVLIPPFALLLDSARYETDPQILNVSTVQLDPAQDYYDIKDPAKAPIDWIYWLKRLWFVALILAIALAVILWFWLRKKKQKRAEKTIIDTRTPAERAKDLLMQLQAQKLWQNNKTKAYYSRCTDILRTYIEESTGIQAMEMVTDELMDATQTRYNNEVNKLLSTALRQADMVKFAKAKPGPETHEMIWQNCMQIIVLTEPKEEVKNDD